MQICPVTVHPNDPQSSIGLTKCMSILRAMRTTWPSASRQLDLFGGARGGVTDNSNIISLTTIPTERNKRSAEHPLNDNSFTGSTPHAMNTSFDYLPSIRQNQPGSSQRPTSYSQEHGNSIFSGDAVYLPPPSSHHPSNSSPTSSLPPPNLLSNPNYSWSAGDMNPHNYNTPLSTAVLPQLFSTGLGDDGPHAPHGRTHPHAEQHPHSSSRRFPPQYFDYSSYPQMGSAYDIPTSVHPQQSQNPNMFMQPPYNIYSMFYSVCHVSKIMC